MNIENCDTDNAGLQPLRDRLDRRREDAVRQAGDDRRRLADREAEAERERAAWRRASRRARVQNLLTLGALGRP